MCVCDNNKQKKAKTRKLYILYTQKPKFAMKKKLNKQIVAEKIKLNIKIVRILLQ